MQKRRDGFGDESFAAFLVEFGLKIEADGWPRLASGGGEAEEIREPDGFRIPDSRAHAGDEHFRELLRGLEDGNAAFAETRSIK